MSREHVRGFLGIQPVPLNGGCNQWMAGASVRWTLCIVAYHMGWVGIGYIIKGIVDLWP